MKTFSIILSIIIGLSINLFSQEFPDEFCSCEKQTINSETLNQERTLFIYLPTDYYKDTVRTYPVHYVSDAPATSGLYFDLIRLHTKTNTVPKSIVIGLSSDGRNENFDLYGNAGVYLEFIQNEVISFVDQRYRTKRD